MIFYFSGTGNSKWVANQLSKEQQEDLSFTPDAWKNDTWELSLQEDEEIGFVFPVYSWAPPVVVQEFTRRLVLKRCQQQYLFFVCSCGDDTGLTRQMMEKALATGGWRCNVGFSVIMSNSYVLFPGFGVGSKGLEKERLAETVLVLEKVSRLITGRETVFACKEGSLLFIKTRIINPLFVRYQMSPKPFHTVSGCIGCKRREKSCPVGNITTKERRPVWGKNCAACLACYYVCLQHMVQYGKKTKDKGHYFNPDSAY